MNVKQKRTIDTLKDLRNRFNSINFKINNKRKALIHVKQSLVDDIYTLGDYCANHLCKDDFNYSFAFRLIENIELNQLVYNKFAKELSLLLEGKDILLRKIDKECKTIGIENV